MSISLTHAKTVTIPDALAGDLDPNAVRPTDWNAQHQLTQSGAGILGAVAAGNTGLLDAATALSLVSDDLLSVSGGSLGVAGGVHIFTPANSLAQGIYVEQTIHGTTPAPIDNNWNFINILSDDADCGTDFGQGFTVVHDYGGSNLKGGRNSLAVYSNFTSTSNSGNALKNYIAGQFLAQSTANDGGTNVTSAGAMFGFGASGVLSGSSATYWQNVTGGEVNVSIKGGASASYKSGLQIVLRDDDTTSGYDIDCLLALSSASSGGTAKVADALLIGSMNSQNPVKTTGNLIRAYGSATVANGIDFRSYTFTGLAFASPNFSVNGAGTSLLLLGATASIELGSTSTPGTPFLDLHSSGNNIDYDVRLIASGGSGSVGQGALTIYAGAGVVIPGEMVIGAHGNNILLDNSSQAVFATFGKDWSFYDSTLGDARFVIGSNGWSSIGDPGATWPATYDISQHVALNAIDRIGEGAFMAATKNSLTPTTPWAVIAGTFLGVADHTSVANSVWGIYIQACKTATAESTTPVLGMELSTFNGGASSLASDPYAVNATAGPVIGLRIDNGTLAGGNIACVALDIVNNGSTFKNGIVIGSDALDQGSGRIPSALSMGQNQAISFYSGAGNIAWNIYSTATSGTETIIFGNDTMGIGGAPVALWAGGTVTPKLQVFGLGANGGRASLARYDNSGNPASWYIGKSRGTTVGNMTIVQSGDDLGSIVFMGADGTNFTNAASITAAVDGTPGASNDMPGRLVFNTCADGSATLTERMRIDNAGNIGVNGTPNALWAGGTITPRLQNFGTDGSTARIATARYTANANAGAFVLGKSRGATVGDMTIVQSGDNIGFISFQGADGTNFVEAAVIGCQIDGTPGAGTDMPARIIFQTCADGTATLTERMRIESTGRLTQAIGTAIPAGGTAGLGYCFSSTANFGTFFGSGAPTLSAAQGSLYLRSDGPLYFNTNGSTGWQAVSYNTARMTVTLTGVNFNSGSSDNAVTISLPPGFTRYQVNGIRISHASHDLTSPSVGTIGLFTSTGGGGTTIIALTNLTVTATAEGTAANIQAINPGITATFQNSTLQVRIGTAVGATATADVSLELELLP